MNLQNRPTRIVRKFGKLFLLLLVLIPLLVWYVFCLPEPLFVTPRSTIILDRNSELLGATIAQDGQWRFPGTDTLPDKFKTCLIQFEDKNFYTHPGFHLPSFIRAAYQNIKEKRVVSGGSTLTMQVIRLSRKGNSRNILEKLVEVILATRLELRCSKDEILALYAANAPFGGNVVGLEAASWRYYNRPPFELSWGETAILAVLPNAPALIYPGKNQEALKAKRDRLIDRLLDAGKIDALIAELGKDEPLPQKPAPLPRTARHLLDRVKAEGNSGQRVSTTIDKNIQEQANSLLAAHIKSVKANEIHNAALLIIDLEQHSVLAYVGNAPIESGDHAEQVDVIVAPRSTGSILKPFLFAKMLDEGEILPNTLIPDIPTNIAGFSPKNFNTKYDGAVPAGQALYRSLNIPAVRMLRMHGVEKFHGTLQRIGLHHINKPASHYGLSLILGGAESSLWDIANAYSYMSLTLNNYITNGGQYQLPSSYEEHISFYQNKEKPSTSSSTPLFSAAAVHLTYQSLLNVNRPGSEAGWEDLSSSENIAWKTGTSFGHRDAWAVGTNARYVVAVWVGNATGEGRPGNTGVSNAAPLMFKAFDALQEHEWFEIPYDDLMQVTVCRKSGHRPSIYCTEVDTIHSTFAGTRVSTCPYHQNIHVDRINGLRTSSECQEIDQIDIVSWFVLPPAMEWYYKTSHPDHRILPDLDPTCHYSTEHSAEMEVIHPKNIGAVKIPKELNGTLSALVFEVAHRQPGSSIFWHLDNEYLGETTEIHQMSFTPMVGSHTLTLVDDKGNELVEHFVVVQ